MRVLGFILVRQLWDRRFLNGIAMGAVTLGVIVLLVIKGIMHGFQDKFYDAILNISAHVTIMDKELRPAPQILTRYYGGPIASVVAHESPPDRPVRIRRPQEMVRDAERIDGILAASALLVGPAALRFGTRELSVDLRGIQPDPQTRVTGVAPYVVAGSYRQLSQVPDGILLGTGVATRLGAKLEDVVLCSSSVGRRLGLRVIGIFDAGVPPLDNTRAYVSLGTAQALFGQPDSVNRIEIRI
ncbi:MAG TPA: ABC transporter permease, partial [Polyangiaceae bacterium]|nr:ABC transporter permease [Polyangiaceae bacterium]